MSGQLGLRRTPIHEAHVKAGARMVPFAGWHMPVQYTGIVDEHRAVRERAGLFDVSHMGEIAVRGVSALDFLQSMTCNDVSKIRVGRAQYNALTTGRGTFVDDLIVYRLAEDDFLLVVNAGNTAKDHAWLHDRAGEGDVEIVDESRDWGQLSVQGPAAQATLAGLVDADLGKVSYYGFVRAAVGGTPAIVSRTGYTGEDGFEVYAPAEDTEDLWYAILAAGAPYGLVPVGLGARDTLRLEARMALYGNDIDDTTSVLEADLGWIVKFDKGEFVGREALERQRREGIARKLVGFETEGRAVARQGYRALSGDRPVGTVTSGCPSPTLGKNIGLAYLPPELWEPDATFEVEIRGRKEPARVVPTPFYSRPRRKEAR